MGEAGQVGASLFQRHVLWEDDFNTKIREPKQSSEAWIHG
ncbi:hypothetical protein HU200_013776 [Digitaria exilis]|uniref:Uncharacterized protein n=1 Tax=Digitaria exilis TaxID=1010633 RepID=A0A835FCW2_9POAL|nr:hypothetical protein HU200_013776 [Digitaria exilis]